MASVNYKKCKTIQEAKAKFLHDATDTRLENDHANEHIDKTKTHLNTSENYADMCKLYDDRIAELDASTNKNKRKDRITLIGLEIPVPKDLPRDKYKAWFDDVNALIVTHYGEKNVLPMSVHWDEEHEYMLPETKEMVMSRVHMKSYVVPEKDGGLNGKWANNRYNIISMNNEIHTMTQEKYDVDFMDGSKRKSKQSVAELKNASTKAEMEAREIEIARRETALKKREDNLVAKKVSIVEQVKILNSGFKNRKKELDAREAGLNARNDDLNVAREEIRIIKENVSRAECEANTTRSEAQLSLQRAKVNEAASIRKMQAVKVPPPGLVEFTKKYTRNMPKREIYDSGLGKKKYRDVRDAAGKRIFETRNCFDDWQKQVSLRALQQRNIFRDPFPDLQHPKDLGHEK